jgi:two-component system response regulator YesN
MYGLLIVDDDKLVRDILSTSIDWRSLDVEVIGAANDGVKALEMCKMYKPHIMITDVRMPRMDGLQLVSELSKLHLSIHTVMISGYGEFDYVKEALKLGAKDYLLKPYAKEEIVGVIKGIVGQMKNEKSEMSAHIQSSRSYLMKELAEGRFRPLAHNKAMRHIFGESWVEQRDWRVALLSVDDYKRIMRDEREKKLIDFAVENILEELIGGYSCTTYGKVEEGKWLIVFQTERWSLILNHVRLALNTNAKITVNISISKNLATVDELTSGIREAYELQEYRSVLGTDRITTRHEAAAVDRLEPDAAAIQARTPNNLYVKNAVDYIQQHFEKDIGLTHVAETLQISPNYLSNLLKKELGTTFLEILAEFRIRKAKELLKTTTMKNYQICEAIGYQSPEYFTKVFKKYTGQNPLDYRKGI